MSSKCDDVCESILNALCDRPMEYAELQRATNIGSYTTIKRHIKHILEKDFVEDQLKPKGQRNFHYVKLTEKGKEYIKSHQLASKIKAIPDDTER